jgi:hypothetical protein
MRRLACGTAAIVALAGLGAASALASTVPSGGKIAMIASLPNFSTGKVMFAGAIGDYGTTVNVDRNGKVNSNGNFVKMMLKQGTLELDVTAVNKLLDNPPPRVASSETCSVEFVASAPAKIINGTGLYKGISGTAKITVSFDGLGSRYTTGPRKGQCNEGQNTPPRAVLGSVVGNGTVNFAS